MQRRGHTMTQPQGILRATPRCLSWGLPWICVLALWASLAYAMDLALVAGSGAGGAPASTLRAAISMPTSTGVSRAESVTRQPIPETSGSGGCDLSGGRLPYVGFNTWVPAEPKVAPCPDESP